MAVTITRFLHTNPVQASATVLSASSAQSGNPVSWLKDQLRSKTWRSKLGWTIVAGFNDKIDFNRGGVKVATIAAGTYVSGADFCVAIVAALEAADATPVWAATYSISTFKFTISSDLAFTLLFGSGANLVTSVALDLGFAESDTGSATSQVAGNAAYQSRHWVKADLVTAKDVRAGVVINHNLSAAGTVKLQGNSTDTWSSPSSDLLPGDSTIRIAFIGIRTVRWWRLLITDVQNSAGYAEVGIWFAGDYVQPSVTYTIGWHKGWVELSAASLATHGALWQDQRPRLREYTLNWSEIPEADRALIEAAAVACPLGKAFFLALDADVTNTNTVYGYFTAGIGVDGATTIYFNIGLVFQEAGG